MGGGRSAPRSLKISSPGRERTSLRTLASARHGIPKTAHHRETPAFRRTVAQLGVRLRELRQARGWTVEEASERYGVEPAHVRRIEAGRTNPSLATLLSIADAVSTELADLFGERTPTKGKKDR
jgi:DNA-binding XRE family transcriptional regulator